MKNDIGKKFGKLTAIENEKDKNGYNTRYICKCDCGNTHSVSKSHLRSGRITHCGCVRTLGSKHHQWTGTGEISSGFWYDHIVRSANGSKLNNRTRKSKKLTITIEYAWDLFLSQARRCALSGLELTFPKVSKDKNWTASLDRIDSSKGYIEGNVQWVHKDINIMKNKFNQDHFIKLCNNVRTWTIVNSFRKQMIEEGKNPNPPLHEQGIDILDYIK